MRLHECFVILLLGLATIQAIPTAKSGGKKSLIDADKSGHTSDLKIEETGDDKSRTKKSTTTFCVEIRPEASQSVQSNSIVPVNTDNRKYLGQIQALTVPSHALGVVPQSPIISQYKKIALPVLQPNVDRKQIHLADVSAHSQQTSSQSVSQQDLRLNSGLNPQSAAQLVPDVNQELQSSHTSVAQEASGSNGVETSSSVRQGRQGNSESAYAPGYPVASKLTTHEQTSALVNQADSKVARAQTSWSGREAGPDAATHESARSMINQATSELNVQSSHRANSQQIPDTQIVSHPGIRMSQSSLQPVADSSPAMSSKLVTESNGQLVSQPSAPVRQASTASQLRSESSEKAASPSTGQLGPDMVAVPAFRAASASDSPASTAQSSQSSSSGVVSEQTAQSSAQSSAQPALSSAPQATGDEQNEEIVVPSYARSKTTRIVLESSKPEVAEALDILPQLASHSCNSKVVVLPSNPCVLISEQPCQQLATILHVPSSSHQHQCPCGCHAHENYDYSPQRVAMLRSSDHKMKPLHALMKGDLFRSSNKDDRQEQNARNSD